MGIAKLSTLRTHWQERLRLWTWSPTGIGWDSRVGTWLRHGVEGLLVLLIVAVLVSFWNPPTRARLGTSTAQLASPAKLSSAAMADKIIAAHLFGQAPVQSVAIAAIDPSISVDGIVYASESEDSQVVLTINGKSDVYKVNQVLPDGETLAAIGPSDIQLTANGASRRLTLPHYGDPGSVGPAAYAALLHGMGLSTPSTEPASARLPGASPSDPAESFTDLSPVPLSRAVSIPSTQVMQIPATATPLEQLQALRAQLIH